MLLKTDNIKTGTFELKTPMRYNAELMVTFFASQLVYCFLITIPLQYAVDKRT